MRLRCKIKFYIHLCYVQLTALTVSIEKHLQLQAVTGHSECSLKTKKKLYLSSFQIH